MGGGSETQLNTWRSGFCCAPFILICSDGKRWQLPHLWVCLISSCAHVIRHLLDSKRLFPGPCARVWAPGVHSLCSGLIRTAWGCLTTCCLFCWLGSQLPTLGCAPAFLQTKMREMTLVSLQKLFEIPNVNIINMHYNILSHINQYEL